MKASSKRIAEAMEYKIFSDGFYASAVLYYKGTQIITYCLFSTQKNQVWNKQYNSMDIVPHSIIIENYHHQMKIHGFNDLIIKKIDHDLLEILQRSNLPIRFRDNVKYSQTLIKLLSLI